MNFLKIKNKIALFVTLIFLCGGMSHEIYALKEETTTPSEVAAPKKNYLILYVINAKYGILKRERTSYQLVLVDVDKGVNYKNQSLQKTESYSLYSFIKKWKTKNKRHVEADITGVQVNHKTIGHVQFYASVMLSDPLYISEKNQLVFRLKPIAPPLNMKKMARFDNATVFINGSAF